jgi:hypothetical protein
VVRGGVLLMHILSTSHQSALRTEKSGYWRHHQSLLRFALLLTKMLFNN